MVKVAFSSLTLKGAVSYFGTAVKVPCRVGGTRHVCREYAPPQQNPNRPL